MLVLLAACADTLTAPDRAVAGCYRVAMSPWQGDASEIAPLPDSIELTLRAGVVALEQGRTVVRAYPDSSRSHYRWSWWAVDSPDTLRLIFSTGFTGARLTLRPRDGGFEGQVSTFVDYSRDSAVAAVRLAPFACAD